MEWTPEIIDRMFKLVEQGYSLALVARELHCTKNCVVGKYARERRKRGIAIPSKPLRQKLAISKPTQKPTKPRPAAFVIRLATTRPERPNIAPKPARKSTVGILDVTGCKWAVGEDASVIGRHTFCNAATADGHAYCEEHRRENVASYSGDLIKRTIRAAMHANKSRAA